MSTCSWKEDIHQHTTGDRCRCACHTCVHQTAACPDCLVQHISQPPGYSVFAGMFVWHLIAHQSLSLPHHVPTVLRDTRQTLLFWGKAKYSRGAKCFPFRVSFSSASTLNTHLESVILSEEREKLCRFCNLCP